MELGSLECKVDVVTTTPRKLPCELKLFVNKVSIYGMGLNKTLVYVCKVSQN